MRGRTWPTSDALVRSTRRSHSPMTTMGPNASTSGNAVHQTDQPMLMRAVLVLFAVMAAAAAHRPCATISISLRHNARLGRNAIPVLARRARLARVAPPDGPCAAPRSLMPHSFWRSRDCSCKVFQIEKYLISVMRECTLVFEMTKQSHSPSSRPPFVY